MCMSVMFSNAISMSLYHPKCLGALQKIFTATSHARLHTIRTRNTAPGDCQSTLSTHPVTYTQFHRAWKADRD